jgi:hypothetical protein
LQPSSVSNTILGTVTPAYVLPPCAGGASSNANNGARSSAGPRTPGLPSVRPGLLGTPHDCSALPRPADDDTILKKSLADDLEGARNIVGDHHFNKALKHQRRSAQLAMASCSEAALGLAELCRVRKEDLRDKEKKEGWKKAKKAARDVLLWRCTGNVLGLDSREALVKCFELVCRHIQCDENTVAQLINGFTRIKEELAGGPPPKQRTAATKPESSRVLVPQNSIARCDAAPGRSGGDGSQPGQGSMPEPSSQGWSHLSPQQASSTTQVLATHGDALSRSRRAHSAPPQYSIAWYDQHGLRAVPENSDHGSSPMRSLPAVLLAPLQPSLPMHVRQPAGWDQPLEIKDNDQAIGGQIAIAALNCNLPRATPANDRPRLNVGHDVGRMQQHMDNNDLAVVLVPVMLQEMSGTGNDHPEQCAELLAKKLHFNKPERDSDLVKQTQNSLVGAVLRVDLDDETKKHLVDCLAQVSGPESPRLQDESWLLIDGTDSSEDDRNNNRQGLGTMMSESWAWMLVNPQDGQSLQWKVDPTNDEDSN